MAVKKLANTLMNPRFQPDDFFRAGLVVATHHDGLRFHQAFIADCVYEDEPGFVTLRPKVCNEHTEGAPWASAWGCSDHDEQQEALNGRASLDHDVEGALEDAASCKKLQTRWAQNFKPVNVKNSPAKPSIFCRNGHVNVDPLTGRTYDEQCSEEDVTDCNDLLDGFCSVFGISPGDQSDNIEVGVVPLDVTASARPRALMFVTNVNFHANGSCDVRPIERDAVSALYDIGQVFGLAHVARERHRLEQNIELVRKELPQWIDHAIRTLKVLEFLADPDGSSLYNRTQRQQLRRLVWRFLDAQRKSLFVTSSNFAQTYSRAANSFRATTVKEVLADLLAEFAEYATANRIDFHASMPGDASNAQLVGDRDLLECLFVILLHNAVEAADACTDAPPSIEFEVDLDADGRLSFHISDSGMPFPVVRDGWYKRQVRSQWYGFGLGLFAAAQIVELHNGEIHDDGRKKFTVKIPTATLVFDYPRR